MLAGPSSLEPPVTEAVRRAVLVLAAAVLLVAVGLGLWARPGGPAEQAVDTETVERLLARQASDIDGVLADAATIRDPILRRVAIDEWVHRNASDLHEQKGERVCLALEGTTRDVCLRKVSSPHLHESPEK